MAAMAAMDGSVYPFLSFCSAPAKKGVGRLVSPTKKHLL
jgi:hypothetical protein